MANKLKNTTIISLVLLALNVGIGAVSAQPRTLEYTFPTTNTPPTLSACQITENVTTNWIAIPGALHIEPDTNGNQVQFLVEREVISTNVILRATYEGHEYSYILKSHPRTSETIHKRMVPIQPERPPLPTPLLQPVAVSSNAVYYREQRP